MGTFTLPVVGAVETPPESSGPWSCVELELAGAEAADEVPAAPLETCSVIGWVRTVWPSPVFTSKAGMTKLPARFGTTRKVWLKFCETVKPFMTKLAEVLVPSTVRPSIAGSWKSSALPPCTV